MKKWKWWGQGEVEAVEEAAATARVRVQKDEVEAWGQHPVGHFLNHLPWVV